VRFEGGVVVVKQAMANKGPGSGNFFMGTGSKFGLTLNPKRAPKKKPVLAAPLAAFGADAEEEEDGGDGGNNFRGARELAREQEANSVANARVQVGRSVLCVHAPGGCGWVVVVVVAGKTLSAPSYVRDTGRQGARATRRWKGSDLCL